MIPWQVAATSDGRPIVVVSPYAETPHQLCYGTWADWATIEDPVSDVTPDEVDAATPDE